MRLLIVSEFPCDAPGGGPAVIRQMISDAGERGAEVFWWSAKAESGGKEVKGVTGSFSFPYPGKLYPTRRFTRLKAFLMERLWAPLAARHLAKTINSLAPDCVWVIPHDWSIPPIGRVMLGSWFFVPRSLLGKVGRGAGKKQRVHVTVQDYPDVHGHVDLWGLERCQRFCRMQDEVYARAETRDATSLPMLEDLRIRTGAPGSQMLHQGLEPEDFAFLETQFPVPGSSCFVGNQEPGTKNQEPIRVAYAGTILCEPEFVLFVEALATLNQQRTSPQEVAGPGAVAAHSTGQRQFTGQENQERATKNEEPRTRNQEQGTRNQEPGTRNQEPGTRNQEPRTSNIELHLYGTHSYSERPWFRKDLIVEHGNLPERELVEALRSCDWGFIPMSLEDTDPRYNRFSFPTKFITYLAAGLPVIAMGHPESSVMKMAAEYQVGITIPTAQISTEQLRGILFDGELHTRAQSEILRCAREHFDAERMRNRLWQNLMG